MENFSANSNLDIFPTDASSTTLPTVSLITALTEKLRPTEIGGLYISNLINIRYLTGFTGSYARLFVPTSEDSEAIFFTDGRYRDQANIQVKSHGTANIRIESNAALPELPQRLSAIVGALSQPSLGVEGGSISWSEFRMLQDTLGETISVQPVPTWIEELRKVKAPEELVQLQRAAEIADLALATIIDHLPRKQTERAIARLLDNAMLDMGADAPSFETIVASGPRAAMPHARPTDRVLSQGDLVVIDFGATLNGYHSDCTRTFSIGQPSEPQRRILCAVMEAQEIGVSLLRPSASCAKIDNSVRAALNDAGFDRFFTHGLGHGIGLEIHEAPWLNGRSDDVLEPSMAVTVEPGVYLPGDCGVRIEDSLVVTETGYKVLTRAPKDWLID